MRNGLYTAIAALTLFGWSFVVVAQALEPAAQAKTKKGKTGKTVKSAEETPAIPKSVSKKADELGPLAVFADIEQGWRKEDVRKILRHYGKSKVGISIEGTGPVGGAFSKNQSHYLLKDLFKYTITRKFEFVQYRNGRNRVYAVAERSYKKNDDGRTFKDKIYVSLHLEGSRWVISEIKSIR
ncbi:MAG: DUF4783 domain-containing protein [Candidatus Krumholzibacteriia bacterium]